MENIVKNDVHVAAVVLNYNSSSDCRKCVSYLDRQTYPNLSIILVDNASTEQEEADELNRLQQEYNVQVIFSQKIVDSLQEIILVCGQRLRTVQSGCLSSIQMWRYGIWIILPK